MRISLVAGAGVGACALALAAAVPASAASVHNVSATVRAAGGGSSAVTYDPAVVPTGAQLTVKIADSADGAFVALDVDGLLPDRGYAAHAHVNPCGETGAAAGPHFQNAVDPAAGPDSPSTDPAYANPENEIWLDMQTDGNGAGHAEAELAQAFPDGRSPRSVVIHAAEVTATHAGHAGTAGDRAACITLPAS